MTRQPTSHAASSADPGQAAPARALARASLAALLGALLLVLAYQLPVAHHVDIGGLDAAYVQGFYDPERSPPGQPRADLAGSDGSARWTQASSYLLFPQAGLPAQITLRLRGPQRAGPPPQLTVLLNGATELGRVPLTSAWQEHTFPIAGGLLKPNDVLIELRAPTAQLDPSDPREVGALLDWATYRVGPPPVLPYPPQLAYGALAAGLLYLVLRSFTAASRQGDEGTRRQANHPLVSLSPRLLVWLAGAVGLGLAFLALYRLQPAYPYPLLRLLPAVDALLAALLALRYGPALARRWPALPDLLALGGVGAWLLAVLSVAQRHTTLSVPSAENDFRVFALRSAHLAAQFPAGTTDPALDGVLRADGFYNLGYPLLLWLARPLFSDNPFLAARAIAALSGALLLLAGWLLARRLQGRGPALLALLLLALSPLVVQQALYVGTDMPFAALCTLALALLFSKQSAVSNRQEDCLLLTADCRPNRLRWVVPAGLLAGLAFLVRHPGLLLLPFGWLVIGRDARSRPALLAFTLAFALAAAPQLAVNLRDTGRPLFSQQAKNIWQAVFGAGDWGRWAEAQNDIRLGQVLAQDPARFLANWWNNLRGFVGTGGEDPREFGQAAQLRLLGFPANWLAVAGLLGWLLGAGARQKVAGKSTNTEPPPPNPHRLLLAWLALYVAAVSVGLAWQGRFALPLAPIYATAAAWLAVRVGSARTNTSRIRNLECYSAEHEGHEGHKDTIHSSTPLRDLRALRGYLKGMVTRSALLGAHLPLLAGLMLLPLLWGGWRSGAEYVLRARPAGAADQPGQPADELAVLAALQARLQPGERWLLRAPPGVPIGKYSALAHLAVPAPASDAPAALRASGAAYLVWHTALGPAPALGSPLASAGSFILYRLTPADKEQND